MTDRPDFAALRQRAEAATQGEWESICIDDGSGELAFFEVRTPAATVSHEIDDANDAAHIAGLSPPVVKAICDYVAELEAERDRLREALRPFAELADEISAAAALYAGPEANPENWAKACEWDDLTRARTALGDKPCNHEGYSFEKHGRCCPRCSIFMVDWGD